MLWIKLVGPMQGNIPFLLYYLSFFSLIILKLMVEEKKDIFFSKIRKEFRYKQNMGSNLRAVFPEGKF